MDWDHKKQLKGVYRMVGGSHNGWSKFVDSELGNYDYLLGADVRMSTLMLLIQTDDVRRLTTVTGMCGKTFSRGVNGYSR